MADGNARSTVDGSAIEIERLPRSKRRKNRAIGLKIAASILLGAGLGAIGGCVIGVQQGWLAPLWNNLTDPQAAVIASALTIYAAALAAVLGPLFFSGQIMSMRDAGEQTLQDMSNTVQQLAEKLEYVRKLVRQTDDLREDHQMDADKAYLALEGIRQDATALAADLVLRSRRRESTKAKFSGKWPGRKNYTNLLRLYNLITDAEVKLFEKIDATRRFTRESLTPDDLAEAQTALRELQNGAYARGPANAYAVQSTS